jgi:transcription factor 1
MFDYLHGQHLKGRSVIGLLPEAAIDLFETEKAVCEKYPDVEIKPMGKMGAARTSTANHPDPVIRKDLNAYYKKRSSLMQIQKTRQAAEAIADIGEDLYYLECKILRMEKGANKDAAMEKLEELDVNWKTELDKLPFNYHSVPDTDLDDRLSLRTPPYSRIQWDSRPYEPLIMRRDEVWPRNSVTLIDATPIPRTAEHAPDYFEWQHDFVYGLFSASADSVEHALDKMQHGLSDIIDQCPSLRDPAKGGRLQMKHLRVRMLTQEMIDELVEAYRNWPFKAPGSEYSKYFRNKGSALQAMSTTLK